MENSIGSTKNRIREKLQDEKYKSIPSPHLVIILVEYDHLSDRYVDCQLEMCNELGIKCTVYRYRKGVQESLLKEVISNLSLNPTVTAISIKTPLPDHINERNLIDEIDPIKDIDGVTLVQAGMLHLKLKDKRLMVPPSEKASIKTLECEVLASLDNICIAYDNQFDFIWKFCQSREISEAELNNFNKD